MTQKIKVNNNEYIRIYGIWFAYIQDKYQVVKNFEELENEYIRQYKSWINFCNWINNSINNSENNMTKTINTNDYQAFVKSTISNPSSNFQEMISALYILDEDGKKFNVSIPELLTAAVGLTAEAGEFTEIVKKLIFQGKPLTEDNVTHLKKEAGDVLWYLSTACTALNMSINDLMILNVEKLSARYPNGFEIIKSEVRKEGDI